MQKRDLNWMETDHHNSCENRVLPSQMNGRTGTTLKTLVGKGSPWGHSLAAGR